MRGDRLRQLREGNRISREKLTTALGFSANAIQRYETGANDASGEALARIAQYFGVSTDYLLGLTDDPTPHELVTANLSDKERFAISAWRRGERLEAMKVIANDDDIVSTGK